MPSNLNKIKTASFDDMFEEAQPEQKSTNIVKSNATFKETKIKEEKEKTNFSFRKAIMDSIPYKAPRAYKTISISLSYEAINTLNAIAANKNVNRSKIIEWMITGKGINDRSADAKVKSSIINKHKEYINTKKDKRENGDKELNNND